MTGLPKRRSGLCDGTVYVTVRPMCDGAVYVTGWSICRGSLCDGAVYDRQFCLYVTRRSM